MLILDDGTRAALLIPDDGTRAALLIPDDGTRAALLIPDDGTHAALLILDDGTHAALLIPDDGTRGIVDSFSSAHGQHRSFIVDLKKAIQLFIAEFSAVETHFVGIALRSLSADGSFVEESEKILGFEARLKLLKRMALVRAVGPELIEQLDDVNLRAAKLREKRDELARTLRMVDMGASASSATTDILVNGRPKHPEAKGDAASTSIWMPTIAEIDKCRTGTAKLQSMLKSIAERVEVTRPLQGNL